MNYRLKKIDIFLFIALLLMGYVSKRSNASLNLNNYLNLPLYFIAIWRISIELNFIHYTKLRVENEETLFLQSIEFILRKTMPFISFTLIMVALLTVTIDDVSNVILNLYHYAFIMVYFVVLMTMLGNYFQKERTFYIASAVMICMFIITFLNTGMMGIHEYLPTTFPRNMNIIPKTATTFIMLYAIYYVLRKWKYEI